MQPLIFNLFKFARILFLDCFLSLCLLHRCAINKGISPNFEVQERAKTLLQKQSESVDTSKAKRQQQCLLLFYLILFILLFFVYLLFRLIFITIFCDMIWPTFKSSKRQLLQQNFLWTNMRQDLSIITQSDDSS